MRVYPYFICAGAGPVAVQSLRVRVGCGYVVCGCVRVRVSKMLKMSTSSVKQELAGICVTGQEMNFVV